MKETQKNETMVSDNFSFMQKGFHRREFIRYSGLAGAAIATGLTLDACSKDTSISSNGVNFGTGDYVILNFAYALEQLEAAFYTKLISSPYSGMSAAELTLLTDVRDHEIAHREFFKAALGSNAIQDLTINFASIDFTSRDNVLNAAKSFEDLGVSAYNGAGRYIKDANYLTLAGKIVSVEARHAAYIRDLISNGSFADSSVIDANGLDTSRKPSVVIAMASAYITTKLDASTLPA